MSSNIQHWFVAAAVVVGSSLPIRAQEAPPVAPNAAGAAAGAGQAAGDAMQVLEQGPIHEAFAEPVALDAKAAITVDREPPAPINELPPDVRPEGKNVQWIPGYWMWTDEQQDFVWVSGVWRDVPPGRTWVPGSWVQVDAGYQWASGYWQAQQVHEVNLLPLPPETLEVGPSSPAPGDNYFWIPGCWIYGNAGYSWRAGYWYAGQPNWVWVPDRYAYTPYGAIFVNGYWDYGLARRGWLYAPVYWNRPVYAGVGWSYRPYSLINTSLLLSSLFIHSNYNHYYFGYGGWRSNYIRPWWSYGYGRSTLYNPFYAYHRWHDGHNHRDWDQRVRGDWAHHHGDWDRHRGDGDRDRDGRRGGRPGDLADGGRPGGRPGDARPGDRDGRPGDGRPGDRRNQLITTPDKITGSGGIARVHRLSDAERAAVQERVKNWDQVRQARLRPEAGRAPNAGDRPVAGNRPDAGQGDRNPRSTGGRIALPGEGNTDRPGNRDGTPRVGVNPPRGRELDRTARDRQADRDNGRPNGEQQRAIIGRPINPPSVGGAVDGSVRRGAPRNSAVDGPNRSSVQRPIIPGSGRDNSGAPGRSSGQPRIAPPGSNNGGSPASGGRWTPRSTFDGSRSRPSALPPSSRTPAAGSPAIGSGNPLPRTSTGPSRSYPSRSGYRGSSGPTIGRGGSGTPSFSRSNAPPSARINRSGGGSPSPSISRGTSGRSFQAPSGGGRSFSSGNSGGGRSFSPGNSGGGGRSASGGGRSGGGRGGRGR